MFDRWMEDIELDVLVTKRCNLNCIHCFLDSKSEEMHINLLRKISNDAFFKLHSGKRRSINFSGGEIFLRKDISEIFSLFKDHNVTIGCVSNGFYLTNEMVDVLTENQVSISLSMDGVEEVHNFYRKNDKAFERLEKAIERLQKRRVPFSLICSVSRINQDRIEEIIKYCVNRKIRNIRFQVVKPEGNALLMQDHELILDDAERQALFQNLMHYCGKYVADINISGYGTFKSELREHGCKFGLKWGNSCHSNSIPWPKSFGIDTEGNIIQMHPFHNNSFWKIGHVNEGIYDVIKRYYASEKHISLLETLSEVYEQDILKSSDEVIFGDLYLEDRVSEKIEKKEKKEDAVV